VIVVVRQNLESGAVARGERLSRARLTCPLMGQSQFARGELGVEAVLDAAGWIAVAQTDKSFSGRRDSAFQADMLGRGSKAPVKPLGSPRGKVAKGRLRPHGLPERVERKLLSPVSQHDGRHERRPHRPDLEASRRHLEKAIGRVVKAGDLSPRVQVGVLLTPVVVLTADPVFDLYGLSVHGQRSIEHRLRQPNQALGSGKS